MAEDPDSGNSSNPTSLTSNSVSRTACRQLCTEVDEGSYLVQLGLVVHCIRNDFIGKINNKALNKELGKTEIHSPGILQRESHRAIKHQSLTSRMTSTSIAVRGFRKPWNTNQIPRLNASVHTCGGFTLKPFGNVFRTYKQISVCTLTGCHALKAYLSSVGL